MTSCSSCLSTWKATCMNTQKIWSAQCPSTKFATSCTKFSKALLICTSTVSSTATSSQRICSYAETSAKLPTSVWHAKSARGLRSQTMSRLVGTAHQRCCFAPPTTIRPLISGPWAASWPKCLRFDHFSQVQVKPTKFTKFAPCWALPTAISGLKACSWLPK